MKRYKEIVADACRNGTVNCMEAAIMLATFEFTEQVFNQGGKVLKDKFTARFGKHAHGQFMVMTGQRRN